MTWRECKSVVGACVLCAAFPTLCFWIAADCVSAATLGLPFWIAGALIGVTIGLVSGLLACPLSKLLIAQTRFVGALDLAETEVVDERAAARGQQYLIGLSLAVIGTVLCCGFLLDVVHNEMRERLLNWQLFN